MLKMISSFSDSSFVVQHFSACSSNSQNFTPGLDKENCLSAQSNCGDVVNILPNK